MNTPEFQEYIHDFGKRQDDIGLAAVMDGRVVGAIWARIMHDYGHIDDSIQPFPYSATADIFGETDEPTQDFKSFEEMVNHFMIGKRSLKEVLPSLDISYIV